MSLSVATIVVANSADDYLSETLRQLQKQIHPIQQVIVVDTATSSETAQLVSRFGFSLIQPGEVRLGAAIEAGLAALAHPPDWVWILHDDSAPEPTALSNLARAAEISPSVAVIGPKLLRWDYPIEIQQMGLTITKTGRPFLLVESEYDQGQFDITSDTLAVSTAGMLVSLSVWEQLGGIDDSSPPLSQDIEFAIKARVAGYRVVVEASARVLHAGLSMIGRRRKYWLRGSYRQAVSKAHIQLATITLPAPSVALLYVFLPLIALYLIPSNLLAKKPDRILGQLTAWIWAWTTFPKRLAQRQRIRAIGPLDSLSSLFATWSQVRAKKTKEYEYAPDSSESKKGFFASGAFYIFLLIPLIAINQFPSGALSSNAFPIGRSFESIWAATGVQSVMYLEGFDYPSDPFNWFFALIALFPISPSTTLSWFVFISLGLAFISTWLLLGLITNRAWLRNLFALGFVLSPPMLALQAGGAVVELVVALTLPLVIYLFVQAALAFNSARSWRWAALAGIVGIALAISSPLFFALLLVFVLGLIGKKPQRMIPLLAGFLPGSVFLFDWFRENSLRPEIFFITSAARVEAVDFWLWPILAIALSSLLVSLAGRPGIGLVGAFFAAVMISLSQYLNLNLGEQSAVLTLLAMIQLFSALSVTPKKAVLASSSFVTIAAVSASSFFFGFLADRPMRIDEVTAPALVIAQAEVDPGTRTLSISFKEEAVAELIWGDGRSVEEKSVIYQTVGGDSSLASHLAELTARLIAANPEEVEELIGRTSVNFILVSGNDSRALATKASLRSMPFFQISGDSRFGSLFRVLVDSPKAQVPKVSDRSLQLWTLLAFCLLAVPTPATVRGYRRRGGR